MKSSVLRAKSGSGMQPSAGGVLTYSDWVAVTADQDFVHQFRLDGLEAATRYSVYVETRDSGNGPVSAATSGSFKTPARPDTWQDVSFTVVTGQSYWDLDHRDGYHIYPAMQRLRPHFIVPTGDTVYLDSEAPRARTVALARYHWHRMYSLPRQYRVSPLRARLLGGGRP